MACRERVLDGEDAEPCHRHMSGFILVLSELSATDCRFYHPPNSGVQYSAAYHGQKCSIHDRPSNVAIVTF